MRPALFVIKADNLIEIVDSVQDCLRHLRLLDGPKISRCFRYR